MAPEGLLVYFCKDGSVSYVDVSNQVETDGCVVWCEDCVFKFQLFFAMVRGDFEK